VAAHDPVALAEIDLYSDLIIAAAATPFERLSADRIDQVLQVRPGEPVDPPEDSDEARVPVPRDGSGS